MSTPPLPPTPALDYNSNNEEKVHDISYLSTSQTSVHGPGLLNRVCRWHLLQAKSGTVAVISRSAEGIQHDVENASANFVLYDGTPEEVTPRYMVCPVPRKFKRQTACLKVLRYTMPCTNFDRTENGHKTQTLGL